MKYQVSAKIFKICFCFTKNFTNNKKFVVECVKQWVGVSKNFECDIELFCVYYLSIFKNRISLRIVEFQFLPIFCKLKKFSMGQSVIYKET